MVAVVEGSREVRRSLEAFRKSVQTRIVKSAQRTALSGLAKDIKAELPGKYKAARQGIGHSLRKGRKGITEGKAGVAVGIRGARRNRMADKSSAKSAGRNGKRRGVGIGWNNLQWFIMGTTNRFHKTTKHPTGKMAFDPAVRTLMTTAWAKGRVKFMSTMETRMKMLVAKEAAKVRAKQ